MRRFAPSLLALSLVATSGCATMLPTKEYRPLVVPAPATRADAFSSAEHIVYKLGANVVAADAESMHLVADLETEPGQHDRYTVDVDDLARIHIAVQTMLAHKDAADRVCMRYSHAREASFARSVLDDLDPSLAVRWIADAAPNADGSAPMQN